MNMILLATDGSVGARLATCKAIELATETGWPLGVVCVWEVPPLQLSAAPPMSAELTDEALDRAQRSLELATQAAAIAGIEAVPYLRHGDTTEQILAVARVVEDPLIVVGSRGRGAVGRVMLGSVSTKLVHVAPCPVLVVRAATGVRKRTEAGENAARTGAVR